MEEDINKHFTDLKEKFNTIKNKGYIKGKKPKSKGNSLTFETLIGKENDEFQVADYNRIEIKVKNRAKYGYQYLTLFSLVPSNCFGTMLKKLRNSYGTPDKTYSNINTLTKSVYANFKTTKQNGYSFKLQIKYSEKKIYLCVYDKNEKLIEKDIYWDFEDIRSAIERKLNYLAFVKYDSKIIDKENFLNTQV